MNKLRKALKAIGLILMKPVLLNKVLSEPDIWEDYMKSNYSLEYGLPLVDMEQVLGDNQYEVGPITFLDGGSLPTDMALLRGLGKTIKDCNYFEIGTWRGESAANMAQVASKCYTLNLSVDELRKMGVRNKYIYLLGYFSNSLDNVVHLHGHSKTFDFSSLDLKFDLIYIDGDHHYEQVKHDTEQVFKYLVHENSIVVWHDYATHPEKIRHEVFAGIMDGTPKEFHSYLYHVSQTKCAIYIKKRFETKKLDPPVEPDEYYKLTMNRESKR